MLSPGMHSSTAAPPRSPGAGRFLDHPGRRFAQSRRALLGSHVGNAAGRRAGLSLQQPTGSWTNGFGYDAARRLRTVDSPAGTFTYTYRGAGGLWTNLALPNTARITNAFDRVGRLLGTYLVTSAGAVSNKHEYLYNAAHQRTRHTLGDNSFWTNTYDNAGQLVVADSTVAAEDRGYVYDAAGNLTVRTNGVTAESFAVNSLNQYTSGPGGSFSYDANGNLTYYGSAYGWQRYYTYDAENQLVGVQVPGYFYTLYTYDGLGRRRVRVEHTWNGSGWVVSQTVRYLYDGWRVIQERDGNNTPTVSYTRGNDLSGSLEGAGGIGGLLARSHGYSGGSWGTHTCYHADGGGNITYLMTAAQGLAARYRYDPYGRLLSSSGSLAGANLYRFASKEVNPNYPDGGGYYHFGYRFYDPNLQRWLHRDPLGEAGAIQPPGHRPPMNIHLGGTR